MYKLIAIFAALVLGLSVAQARGNAPSTDDIADTWDTVYNETLRQCVGPRHVEGTTGVRYWDCVKVATEKATAVVRARYN